MCGIAGLYNAMHRLGGIEQVRGLLDKMLLTIQHRGPDADGAWIDADNRCALGHRRLSIIDTSDAGRQPMASTDQRWWISFNGEIYNFQELRGRLEAIGIHPRGRTDTEVLILGLQHWGTEFLPWIDGMFALAAFDTVPGELLLARDAFGEKPLYYTELAAGTLAFASEVQVLEVLPGFDDEVSLDAMAEVLMFQYIGSPRSIYREVHKLLPGQWMKVTPKGKTFGTHFKFSPAPEERYNRNEDDLADELEELLVTSLRRRLIADVPLGAFLSGGVDSSTVCALIRRRLGVPLKTFSMGFEGSGESEHETARAFAEHLGTEHYEKILTPDSSSFLKTVGSLLDEPNGDSSCLPTYLLSEFARQHVTVAISGDGGDELFAGYGRFMSTIQEFGEQPSPGSARVGEAYYSDRILVAPDGVIQTLFGDVPPGLARHLHALREGLDRDGRPLHSRLRQTDLENYMPGAVLPKMDRMSMRHSLEVRTPFLNRELAGFAERLGEKALYSGAVGKQLLRRVACRHLPPELVNMPKRGFAIPTSHWAPDELWALTRDMLFSDDSRLLQVFGAKRIEAFVGPKHQFSGRAVYRVWGLVMLESWCRHHAITLPRLSWDARRRGASVEGAGPATLFARQVAPQVYAAIVLPADEAAPASKALERALPHNDLLCMALSSSRTSQTRSGQLAAAASVYSMPLTADAPASEWTKQSSLLLVDGASLPKLGSTELRALQAGGVREILSLDPYRSDGQVIRLSIQQPRLGLAAWLQGRQQRRVAVVRQRLKSLRAPGSGQVIELRLPEHDGDHRGNAHANLFARYAVRVGSSQLPPLPVRNDVMASRGDGRYHVFGRSLTFSLPRTADRNDELCVTRADAAADDFHAEEIAAPLGDSLAGALPPASGAAPARSVIPLTGSGGVLVFMGSLLEQDLPGLADLPGMAGSNVTDERVTLLTVTPVARDLAARLPVDLEHRVLDRMPLDDWLESVPDLWSHRSVLWPQWSAYGQVPAVLLGQIRKCSPKSLVLVGEAAHAYVRVLQTAGGLPTVG